MNLSPQYFDHQAITAPYIVTMQIQTNHLRAFTVGTTGSISTPTPARAKTHQRTCLPKTQAPPAPIAARAPKQAASRSQRSDEEWISALADKSNPERQHAAHEELSSYLYIVAYNYLQKRANDIQRLNTYKTEEIVELAKDFVQSVLLKLAIDEHALLDKYSGLGRFTSWAAQVTTNLIASELRRGYWQKQYMPDDGLQVAWIIDEETVTPHNAVEIEEISETLLHLLGQLSDQQRTILLRCFAGDERPSDVAKELDITPNALYIIAHRAKAKMRKLLEKAEVGVGELALFN